MKTSMIINRLDRWFDPTDVELDECYIAIQLLKKLSTRKKMGLDYDRFKLASVLYNRSSSEAINTIDNAIVLLISRNLVYFKSKKEGKKVLLITEFGESAYKTYKEDVEK